MVVIFIAGGLATIFDIFAVLSGELRCFGTLLTVAFWVGGYRYMGSVISGVILGSCVSYIVFLVVTFGFMAITVGNLAAVEGISNIFHYFKK